MDEYLSKLWNDLDKVARSRGTTAQELLDHISRCADPSYKEQGLDLNHPNDMLAMYYVSEALPGTRILL